MNSAKINDWLQVVGLFGVIGSLMFVGLQMKQDQEIAMSATSQGRTELAVQFIMDAASNPIIAAASEKLDTGSQAPLTYAENRAMNSANTGMLFMYENLHYQYINGFSTEERWRGAKLGFIANLRPPSGPRQLYEQNPQQWRSTFQQVVDELLAEIDAEDVQ